MWVAVEVTALEMEGMVEVGTVGAILVGMEVVALGEVMAVVETVVETLEVTMAAPREEAVREVAMEVAAKGAAMEVVEMVLETAAAAKVAVTGADTRAAMMGAMAKGAATEVVERAVAMAGEMMVVATVAVATEVAVTLEAIEGAVAATTEAPLEAAMEEAAAGWELETAAVTAAAAMAAAIAAIAAEPWAEVAMGTAPKEVTAAAVDSEARSVVRRVEGSIRSEARGVHSPCSPCQSGSFRSCCPDHHHRIRCRWCTRSARHRLHKGIPVVEGVGGSAVVAKAAEDIP